MSNRLQHTVSRFTFHVSRHKFLAATLAIACVAAWPLLAEPGLLNTRGGGDSPFLLQRLQQMETAVLQGHFPVRWMPDANYGYGYPFFNYYAPLSIYITLLFRFIGFSYVRAIQLSQLAGFLVAAAGMLALARRWFKNDWTGLLAATAYTIAPFHMVNVYVRGDSLAEFWAMAFYPLVILAADGVASGKWRVASDKVAWLGLAYAGLILSHNISALIFSPFLLLYILLRGWQSKIHHSPFTIHHSLLALLLAFALSAWFFIPALAEQNLAQLGPVTEGYFHFSNHFRGLDLVQGRFFFDYNPDGGRAFAMGLVWAVTAVSGLVVLFLRLETRDWRPSISSLQSPVFITLSFLIATFMITPLSRFLWDNLPLLPFTQFPWRFLSVQAFAGALAVGGLALLPWRKIVVPVTAVLLLSAGLGHLKTDHLTLTDADVTAEKLAQYEWFTGNIGTTISAEYLPHTVQSRPYTSAWLNSGQRDNVRALSGELVAAQRTNERMTHQIWQVETGTSATLIFPTLHWPGWVGEIDGERVEIRPSPGSGLIMLDAPAGDHTITLRLTRTPLRLAAELVSLAALLLTIGLLVRDWRRETGDWRFSRQSLISSLLLAVLIIALGLGLQPSQPTGLLTWDFDQMAYLHHDEAVQFSSGAVLTGYTFSQETVMAGETLEIELDWETAASTSASLALATPAQYRQQKAPLLVEQTKIVSADQVRYQLEIPANAPPGLYVPRLVLDNGRALTPSGQTRGDLYLRPLHIAQSPISNLQSPISSLDVLPLNVQPHDGVLDVQLAWWTARPLSHNYNVSLRLLNGDGAVFGQFDAQPGYGFLPSSGWPVNEWVNDWLTAPIPPPENAPYALVAILYDVATGENVLTRRLGELDSSLAFQGQEPLFDLPEEMMEETAVFTTDSPLLQLLGWQRHPDALTLYWQSLAATSTNYTRFLHITDPTTGEMLAQVDGYAMGDSYPTSQWLPGEIITDTIYLDWSALPDDAAISLGWYENLAPEFPRLTAVAPNGSPFPDNRVPLRLEIGD
jgi:hypothetical protein